MKRALVTGGRGALGYHLVNALIKDGVKVVTCDYVDEFPYPTELYTTYTKEEKELLISCEPSEFHIAFNELKPDIVFHLAEETKPDWELMDHAINDNIAATARVVRLCSARGIRCVVPVWMEMSLDTTIAAKTPWHYSIAYRRMLPKLFNRGNAVNNIVLLPRILMSETNENSWGALVKRVYNSVQSNNELPVILYEGEVKERLSQPIYWCTPKDAVEVILNSAKIRTRSDDSYIFERTLAMLSPMDITEYLCDKYGLEDIPIFMTMENSGEIKPDISIYTQPDVRKDHLKLIDEVTDVWDRCK